MTRVELWAMLEARAVEARDSHARLWNQAQADTQRLQGHLDRLNALAQDYAQQHRSQHGQAHQVHQTASIRHAVNQVLSLQQRVGLQVQAAQAHEEQCRQRLLRAEAEVLKARTLGQRALSEMHKVLRVQEQRAADSAALQRHWRQRLSGGED